MTYVTHKSVVKQSFKLAEAKIILPAAIKL